MKAKDLTGKRFGKLTVLSLNGITKSGARFKCLCDCGKLTIVDSQNLKRGNTRSCGCLKNRSGKSKIPEYKIWYSMIQRCLNKSHSSYHNYGLRGVNVCDRWLVFENFLSDIGPRPKSNGRSRFWIERKNNSLGYFPGNVVWASPVKQGRNRRTNHLLSFNGESLCVTEWAQRIGISSAVLRKRIRLGWNDEEILCRPIDCSKRNFIGRATAQIKIDEFWCDLFGDFAIQSTSQGATDVEPATSLESSQL
jgi:hypothetical protein